MDPGRKRAQIAGALIASGDVNNVSKASVDAQREGDSSRAGGVSFIPENSSDSASRSRRQ